MRNKDKLDFINQIVEETKKQCDIHNISSSFYCGAETTYDEEHNETYCKECGRCV